MGHGVRAIAGKDAGDQQVTPLIEQETKSKQQHLIGAQDSVYVH